MNIRSYIIDHLSHFMRTRYKLGQNLYKLIDQYEKNYMLSQDEIDALVNEIDKIEKEKDEQLSFFPNTFTAPTNSSPIGKVEYVVPKEHSSYSTWPWPIENGNSITKLNLCDHKWKLYQGLNEVYEYCTTCDAKK